LIFFQRFQPILFPAIIRDPEYFNSFFIDSHRGGCDENTGFPADWMPAGEMEGRKARCLATAKKSMFPVQFLPE